MHIKIDLALWSNQETVKTPNGGAKNEMRPLVQSGAWACPAFPSPEPVAGPLGTVSSLARSIRHVMAVPRFQRSKDILYLKSLSFS